MSYREWRRSRAELHQAMKDQLSETTLYEMAANMGMSDQLAQYTIEEAYMVYLMDSIQPYDDHAEWYAELARRGVSPETAKLYMTRVLEIKSNEAAAYAKARKEGHLEIRIGGLLLAASIFLNYQMINGSLTGEWIHITMMICLALGVLIIALGIRTLW